ncbi:TraB/GumN family protein [Hyphococcus lacteus]|uniref:TraB/GumN family protein n=1 Tax=Hyphococcus lacteus TaxID=3143536 RepID=A0ABV3Z0Q6_9PROT
MKNVTSALLRSFLGPAAIFLATPTLVAAQAPEEVIEVETATPAMWRVTDDDSEYYLLGTFHILPPNLNWRTDDLAKAIETAETVYFEVDADAPDAASKTLNVMMTEGFNAPGKTLSGMLESNDAQKLRDIASDLNIPFAAIDTMRPWNAFLSLSVQFIVNQGFEPGSGVDSVLLKEAKQTQKDVRFFETLEEQLSLFTGLDADTEKMLLVVTLRDWEEQEAAFDDLFSAWVTGNAAFLDEQMNDILQEQAPSVYERLIVARNKAWANELDAALKNESGKGLVAVGAAHLVGDQFSVPALLAAKGYEVSRVDTNTPANDNNP